MNIFSEDHPGRDFSPRGPFFVSGRSHSNLFVLPGDNVSQMLRVYSILRVYPEYRFIRSPSTESIMVLAA